jgi:thiamine-monophosphate kinase
VVPRCGARPGDLLLVTGALGGPGSALRDWESGRVPTGWARERFASPVPRLEAGEALAAAGATAMLDISDGLAADARHMAAASRVDLRLDVRRVPCGPGIAIADALSSGEEYELLVACPPDIARMLLSSVPERYGVPLNVVGEVVHASSARPSSAGTSSPRTSSSGADTASRGSYVERHDNARGGTVHLIGIKENDAHVEFTPGHDHFMI